MRPAASRNEASVICAAQGHISFAASHGKLPGESITLDGITYQLFVEHCLQNTRGAQLPEQLKTHLFDKIVRKGTEPDEECFSAFASFGKRRDTGLAGFLRQRAVQHVYLTGVTLEQCVKQTAQDAIHAGFETTIIEDACAPVDPKQEIDTLEALKDLGAHLIKSQALLQ